MPHKPAPKAQDQVQFVSCSLTLELKPLLRAWADEAEMHLWELLTNEIAGGYRFTVKEEEHGYQASLAPLRQNSPNKGRILCERGGTPVRAVLRLLWAHSELYKGLWPGEATRPEDDW